MSRITALFDSQTHAAEAVQELQSMGATDAHLSFISRHGDEGAASGVAPDAGDGTAEGAGKGLLAGAGVGALFGLAAAFIPGVGPFITAGVLATTLGAAGGGALAGAVVGGASGAVAGALANAGYTKEEADYYGTGVESGNFLVAVDTDSILSDDQVRAVLARHGGRSYGV